MRTLFTVGAAFLCLLSIHPRLASARTWHVDPAGTGDAPTIQAGIDSAAGGDVVLLAPGTYTGPGNRDVDFRGKAVTVASSGGAEGTTIDCEGLGRGFLFASGEGFSSVLSAVRVVNGAHALYGGAVYCVNASPKIQNSIFLGNHAGIRGGAVCCDTSSAVLTGNVFEGNDASYGGAAALYGFGSASLSGNVFLSNDAAISGGAVACSASLPSIVENRFEGNAAVNDGGAIHCRQGSHATISANTFVGNTSGENGGAVGSLQSSPTLEYNLFRQNQATLGGAVYCDDFSAGPIRYNTFDENEALSGAGAGVYCTNFSAPPISNNIVVASANGNAVDTKNNSAPRITCCCFFNNAGGDALPPGSFDGGGNFAEDPQFCGIDGSGNYFLQSDSPCAPGNTPAPYACGQIGAFPVACATTATYIRTWGAIKALYGGE